MADAGSVDLEATLAKACHVSLYGVLFDFNKSTLQPSSDAALQPAANMMAADKALKVEVQGHTDNVGNDAYNQALSEGRAKAVVAWLAQHGVCGPAHGQGLRQNQTRRRQWQRRRARKESSGRDCRSQMLA